MAVGQAGGGGNAAAARAGAGRWARPAVPGHRQTRLPHPGTPPLPLQPQNLTPWQQHSHMDNAGILGMSWVFPCCNKSTSTNLQISICLGLHLSDLAQQISSCLDALIFCRWTLFPPVSDEYLNIKQGSDASRHACAQGNEFSYYMLLTSSFMLNYCERVHQWTIFPWALTSCNQPNSAAQLRAVSSLTASCSRSVSAYCFTPALCDRSDQ